MILCACFPHNFLGLQGWRPASYTHYLQVPIIRDPEGTEFSNGCNLSEMWEGGLLLHTRKAVQQIWDVLRIRKVRPLRPEKEGQKEVLLC